MSQAITSSDFRAERIDTSNKWYELFQKGVELGTWDVETLFEEVDFRRDRERWASLEADERKQIRYLLSGFLDGEFAVGEDASHHLQRIVGAPCFDHSEEMGMYMTMFTLTEHKHTQFLDVYMHEVMGDQDVFAELNPKRGGARIPIVQATGLGEIFDRQGQLTARAAHSQDPVDIAEALTVYHMIVEGLLARGGFYSVNKLSANAPLPLLNHGFKLISTDEGRHITHGVEALGELIEKERAGKPEFQGVSEAIVDVLYENVGAVADFGYMFTDAVGDPLEIEFDDLLFRVGHLIDGQFNEALDLDIDHRTILELVADRHEDCLETDIDEAVREYRDRYQRQRGVETDGGR
ncbi:ribonucleotide-diphosphate reductase subunit beta [Natrinema longum]|uniref:Ribonucleotide-diphosphate reductase subunit beta n=1 Tax=Natrinema longum TaxID=370324 RepID=A0A8A2U661_9EURY|nr:ribonucleotide-diphosphate reductase subunit beta [Natrinema longum]MBZ6494328.1 ribonucleotide-diphosphate reductase subunit beta [Natrinema longum]QSW84349.1 ribonucleotide-diphosphate reductase subunit beta [Natrinema longum]